MIAETQADHPSNAWATGIDFAVHEPYCSPTSAQPPTYAWTANLSGGYRSSYLKTVDHLWV